MRRFPFVVAVIALACTACSKEASKPPPRVEAATAPVPPPPPPPASEVATPAEPAAATPPEVTPVAAARSTPPPPERVVRVVPAKERRIHALINNAISRDVTGQTEHDAAMWHDMRATCKTQACVDRAYAAQETELRKWEGSEDIH